MKLLTSTLSHSVRQSLRHHAAGGQMPGIASQPNFDCFLKQIYDSIRRVEYIFTWKTRKISPNRADPSSTMFDPLMAAMLHEQAGRFDEACWLVFLATHCGKHRKDGWLLARNLYGACGAKIRWDWNTISQSPQNFVTWLAANQGKIRGKFGNHRKYVTLKPRSKVGTGTAFMSYVNWVNGYGSHSNLLAAFKAQAGGNPSTGKLFNDLYSALDNVVSFGRTGKFDYLTMMGKVGLFPVEPDSPYIQNSTGPRKGADLLWRTSPTAKIQPKTLETKSQNFGNSLTKAGVRFAMQVLEDALCNWQKSPSVYKRFSG